MYILKRYGESGWPCSVPLLMPKVSLTNPDNLICPALFLYIFFKTSNVLPFIPNFASFWKSASRQTESKAFRKSTKKQRRGAFSFFLYFDVMVFSVNIW